MIRSILLPVLAATAFVLSACSPAVTAEETTPQPAETTTPQEEIEIVESPIAENTYTSIDGKREIDTVVVHYASAINWFDPSFQEIVGEESREYAESIGLTPDNIDEHKYDWRLVKAIFEAYNVSAHYAIARDGTIVRFVEDNDRAWHAGRSEMPTDGRTAVNDFSIGIELMSSHPDRDPTVVTPEDAYTEEQYESLNKIIAKICESYAITAVVGHDEIAPDRKTDPGPLFQWERVRNEDYTPTACE